MPFHDIADVCQSDVALCSMYRYIQWYQCCIVLDMVLCSAAVVLYHAIVPLNHAIQVALGTVYRYCHVPVPDYTVLVNRQRAEPQQVRQYCT